MILTNSLGACALNWSSVQPCRDVEIERLYKSSVDLKSFYFHMGDSRTIPNPALGCVQALRSVLLALERAAQAQDRTPQQHAVGLRLTMTWSQQEQESAAAATQGPAEEQWAVFLDPSDPVRACALPCL